MVPQPRKGVVHIRDDRIGHKGGMQFGVETHGLDLRGIEEIIGQAQVTKQFKARIVEQVIDTRWCGPSRVLQAGRTALVLGPRSVSVVRRGADRAWRYAISFRGE